MSKSQWSLVLDRRVGFGQVGVYTLVARLGRDVIEVEPGVLINLAELFRVQVSVRAGERDEYLEARLTRSNGAETTLVGAPAEHIEAAILERVRRPQDTRSGS